MKNLDWIKRVPEEEDPPDTNPPGGIPPEG
jgi:hypothetical protein